MAKIVPTTAAEGQKQEVDEKSPTRPFAGIQPPHDIDLAKRLDELKVIARNVALDANLAVRLGREGGGSYCAYGRASLALISARDRRITMDPRHILLDSAQFVVAHEGMHACVTFSPFTRELYPAIKAVCNPEKLHEELGVGAFLNQLEDAGGNSWLFANYPGFKESGSALYDSMLRCENPTMGTPEIAAIAAQIGFFPRFAQFGSEVMKKWWTGEYSKKLDPDVAVALDRHKAEVARYLTTFPNGQAADLRERQQKWIERYLTAVLEIYPSIKALVDKDLNHAAQQQLANRLHQQEKQGQQGQQGQPAAAGQSTGRSPSSSSAEAAAGGGLQKRVQDEINRRAAAHQDKLREDLKRALNDFERHIDGGTGAGSSQPRGSQTPNEEELADRIEALKKKVAEQFGDSDSKEQHDALDRQLETFKKLNDAIKEQSAPINEHSDEAKDAIEQVFKKLTPAEREALKAKARELLEDLEDKIRESLESELEKNAPQKHGERRKIEQVLRDKQEREARLSKDVEQAEIARKAMLGEWDRVREVIASQVNVLYSRLERLLRPSVPEFEPGHSSGSRPNMAAVMQAEADRKLVTKMWERKSLPIDRDFAFSLLVDISESMAADGKEERARECAVLMSEILTRLKVPFEISVFDDSPRVIKSFDATPPKAEKNRMAMELRAGQNGTQDFNAVRDRTAAMVERPEEHKFLIVITDGQSADLGRLMSELDRALQAGVRVIGLGLGPATSYVSEYYPIGRGGLSIDPTDRENAVGAYFMKTLEQILTNPQKFVGQAQRKRGGNDGSNNGE